MAGGLRSFEGLGEFKDVLASGCPALMYHSIDWFSFRVRRHGLHVSPILFRRQMTELKSAGCNSILPDDLRKAEQPNSFVITFDDGFRNVLDNGLPVLGETGFRAIQFVVAGLLGRSNEWDAADGERTMPLMDAEELRQWIGAGHGIGAHTMTHARLTRVSPAAAREEISASKKQLEDQFQLPVRDFAYPYGDYDSRVRDMAAEAGFERAWTTEPGLGGKNGDPMARHRYAVAVSLRNPWNLLRSLRLPLGAPRR